MKVILNKDWANLGEEGDIVDVKSGYARNYLIPQKIAVYDSPSARAVFKTKAAGIAKRKEEKRLRSLDLKKRLEEFEVKFVMPVGDNGRIFGSVTAVMIQDYFAKEGIEIERKKIEVNSKDIKMPGNYSFTVLLYGGESQVVKLVVEAEAKAVKPAPTDRKPRSRRPEKSEETEAEKAVEEATETLEEK